MFFYRTEQPLVHYEKHARSFACGFFRLVHIELDVYYFYTVLLRVEIHFLCGLFRNVACKYHPAGRFSANFGNCRVKAHSKLSRASAQAERL